MWCFPSNTLSITAFSKWKSHIQCSNVNTLQNYSASWLHVYYMAKYKQHSTGTWINTETNHLPMISAAYTALNLLMIKANYIWKPIKNITFKYWKYWLYIIWNQRSKVCACLANRQTASVMCNCKLHMLVN